MRILCSLLTAAILFILAPATAFADSITVPVAGDTFVRSDMPDSNFGSVDPLHVDGDPVRKTLLYFPNTPTDVTSAKLRVHVRFHTGEPFSVRLLSCMGWTESTVTYDSLAGVQQGETLATFVDDPVGYVEVPIPADQLNTGFGGTSPTSNCFLLEKTGENWMTLSSRESSNPAQLVVETTAPPPPPPPSPPPSGNVDDCSGGAVVSATPSTLSSAVASADRVIVNAQPGTYGGYGRWPSSTQSCVKIKCIVAAKTGDTENSGGCRATGQWGAFGNIRNLTVEGFHFVTSDDYGVQVYNESPILSSMNVRVADNVFHGNMYHDISTKSGNHTYTEVLNNLFISCMRHCWEIGQNGNIRTRPSTALTNVFSGNTVSSRINAVTNRATVTTTVTNNKFGSVAGYAVVNQTYWALYPFGSSGDNGALYVPGTDSLDDPYVPLRTTITGNSFSSGDRMKFEGRGVIDDVVKVHGNSGATPSCSRVNMPSDTASAHINEQTVAPPKLDSASDIGC